MIRATALTKRYGGGAEQVLALAGVDLAVPRGNFAVLLGRSGSGKTTLLNLIGGLDRPTSGRIEVGGDEISGWDDERLTLYRRDSVGFVFQFFQLLPSLSASENVALPLWLAGRARQESRAATLLGRVGLAGRERAFPHELSGGEQQRVAIARALVNEPKLLLADEPTGNLDEATGSAIIELLKGLTRERGLTAVVATHSAEAAASADLAFHLVDGRIAGSPRLGGESPPGAR